MTAFLQGLFKSLQGSSDGGSPRVVGIDIGSTSTKMVELQERDGILTLTTYGEIQHGPYAEEPLGKQVQLGVEQEQTATIDLMREASVRANHAVFTVPLNSSFVTVVTIALHEKNADVSSQVRVEARKYIPIPINDVTLDWAEISRPEREAKEGEKEVLLAAIQNDVLKRLYTLMQKTNFSRQPTEIESFSAMRALTGGRSGGVAIIDVGGGSAKLYITKNGLLEQLHRVRVGGSMATEKIASALSVSFQEAEEKKRNVDLETEEGQEIVKIHHATFERAFREFRQVIEEHEKKYDQKIETITLTGGVTLSEGFTGFAEEVLKRDLSLATPFEKVAYPAFMEDLLGKIGPSFSVALGAAMRMF